MNKLEEMHEDDPFLEHLENLKEHPGWLAYQAWIDRQEKRGIEEIVNIKHEIGTTNYIRGRIHAFRDSRKALQILIDEHKDKLKEVRK